MGDLLPFASGLAVGVALAWMVAAHVIRVERAANTERLGSVLTRVDGYRAKRGADPSVVIQPRGGSPVVTLKVVSR